MATLGTMKTRIADELARADLTDQIARAITSAVDFYGQEAFTDYFYNTSGEQIDTATLQAGNTEIAAGSYGYPGKITAVVFKDGTNRYPLKPITYGEYLDLYTSTATTGTPAYFAQFGGSLWIYPEPASLASFDIHHVQPAGVPTADTRSNFWTTDAEELIRTRAKIDLLENVIRSEEAFGEADRLRRREAEALARMRRVTGNIVGTGRVVAWQV